MVEDNVMAIFGGFMLLLCALAWALLLPLAHKSYRKPRRTVTSIPPRPSFRASYILPRHSQPSVTYARSTTIRGYFTSADLAKTEKIG
jgi:hypothetical protein